MGYRVDSLTVRGSIYIEFEGQRTFEFVLHSPDADDPLVLMALERNRQINEAAARAEGPATGMLG